MPPKVKLYQWQYSRLSAEESLNGLSANFVNILKMKCENLCKHLKTKFSKPQVICVKIFNDHIAKVSFLLLFLDLLFLSKL